LDQLGETEDGSDTFEVFVNERVNLVVTAVGVSKDFTEFGEELESESEMSLSSVACLVVIEVHGQELGVVQETRGFG
jgi:hypothetical protein